MRLSWFPISKGCENLIPEKDSSKRKQNDYHGMPRSQVTSWKRKAILHFEGPVDQTCLDWKGEVVGF